MPISAHALAMSSPIGASGSPAAGGRGYALESLSVSTRITKRTRARITKQDAGTRRYGTCDAARISIAFNRRDLQASCRALRARRARDRRPSGRLFGAGASHALAAVRITRSAGPAGAERYERHNARGHRDRGRARALRAREA